MAITKKTTTENTTKYDIKVTRVKEFASGDIGLDLIVNGITIYGCTYKAGTSRNGKEYAFVSFPSHKGSDDKYYNHVYFKMSDDDVKSIEKQIEEML